MIYADYNGSAPLLGAVKEYLGKRLSGNLFANPNAIHSMGQKVSGAIEKSRNLISEVLGCYPDQIIFNSGASEGVSHILFSILSQADKNKNVILTGATEHAVVPEALESYADEYGLQIKKIAHDQNGITDLEDLKKLLKENKVALVTVMAVNNETGVIQPYSEIAKICGEHGVEYFCDTTQLIGKDEFHFEKSGLNYAVLSGHKLGALSGSGLIIVKEPTKLKALIHGSGQEHSLRGGTQNYLGIESLAVALNDFHANRNQFSSLKEAKEKFEDEILQSFPENVVIIGKGAPRLAGTTLIGYKGIHGQAVQIELESNDIFVTTSAACSDNQPETSDVLRAMGIEDQLGRGVIRISLSYSHGEKEYSAIASALKSAYNKLSRIQSY